MPIRPENRSRYPKDWPAISQRIRQRADGKCEECGVPNYELGGRLDGDWFKALPTGDNGLRLTWPQPGEAGWCRRGERTERLRIVRIILTVAHLDHTPENCADDNLKALCQRCHNRYDSAMRRSGIRQRARAKMAIGDLL
ncbi:MAG: hypothetical protein KF889_25320 [Alphaproteobacteria bacterium]|nr:hypothetical protein [Alphaproteobacteria bacterium]MCW5739686.1 hypothetical protein [Alphaproteobacteria bacterium]